MSARLAPGVWGCCPGKTLQAPCLLHSAFTYNGDQVVAGVGDRRGVVWTRGFACLVGM